MKKFLLIMGLMPALLLTGCVQTALMAVSVVNAVDSVSDMAERHEERKQLEAERKARVPSQWDGQNISNLFVSWGQPGQVYQKHPSNRFGGHSYVWAKSCGPVNEGIEGRSLNPEKCQVLVHADRAGLIRELSPGPECGACYGLFNPY